MLEAVTELKVLQGEGKGVGGRAGKGQERDTEEKGAPGMIRATEEQGEQ